jgi:hypothetical protein
LMIIRQSPLLPVPGAKKTAPHVLSGAEKGNLRTSPGETGASRSQIIAVAQIGPESSCACQKDRSVV